MTFHAYLQYVCLLVVCLCTLPSPMEARVQADRQSTGTRDTLLVIDQESGLPIEGAYILTRERLLVSSPRGMIVFGHGTCFMDTVLVQCLGYGSRRVPLNEVFKESSIHTVCLSPDIQKLGEVVVTGERAGASPNVVSRRLSSPEIRNALGTSLATLLERVSGVSSISTGTTVSKPVIQGMYGNRILIIHNGARQTGQQWGADHAPEVDMNGSSSVSVIKGSDAVRYGSDALGGIIVMEQSPLPFRKRSLQGGISALYGSNGRRYVATGQLEGAFPGDFAWRLQGTWSNSGDRSTAHYLLNNTGTREYHASASLGYDRGRLRVEGFYSRFYSRTGVMLSAQMGSEDLLAERIRLGRPLHTDPFSRGIRAPCQEVTHQIAFGRMRLGMKKGGSIHWQSTWQKDDRQENRVRRLDSNIPAVSLHLNSFQHLLRWKRDYRSWQVEAGGQVMFIENHSRAGTGFVPVIPNYTETQAGIYGIGKYHLARGGVEAGLRLDMQETRASGYDWTGGPYGGIRKFNNVSYSLGGHYQLSRRWRLTSNFGLAWRAPHVYELYSNGNELGSGMFVRGDSAMHSERSYKWISSLRYGDGMFSVCLDGYLQWVDGYIYDGPEKETVTVISGAYPVFQYRQTPAFFRGMDFDLRFTPGGSWDYHAVVSFIRANERTKGNYLPYIPSFRFSHELAWIHETKSHLRLRLNIRHRFTAKQRRFDPDTDLIPYTPPAYHLLGFDAALELPVKRGHQVRFMLSADNLLNREYKEYTNRSRYYAHDMGRDVRCGVNWIFLFITTIINTNK